MNKLLVILLLFTLNFSFGQSRYWISTTSGSWSDVNNWSSTDGGVGGASLPKSSDKVFFIGNDKGDCNVDVDVDVLGVECSLGFNSVVSFNTPNVNIGVHGLELKSGSIIASDAKVNILGNVNLESEFVSTTGVLTLNKNLVVSDKNNFNALNGKVVLEINSTMQVVGDVTFYELNIIGGSAGTDVLTIGNNIEVNKVLSSSQSTTDIRLDGGNVYVSGDLEFTDDWLIGTSNLILSGSENQKVSHITGGVCKIGQMELKKTNGSVQLFDNIEIESKLSFNSGVIKVKKGKKVIFKENALAVGSSIDSHIYGTVVKKGLVTFEFPLGSEDKYAPVTIKNIGSNTEVTCDYLPFGVPNLNQKDPNLTVLNSSSYWSFNSSNSTSLDLEFAVSKFIGMVNLPTIADHVIVLNTNQNWSVVSPIVTTDESIVVTSIIPTGQFNFGSTTSTECYDGVLYWVGGNSSDWNDPLNWSKVSGGENTTTIPCQNSTVVFDENSSSTCVLSNDVHMSKILIMPAFDGDIQTNGNIITVTELFK